MEGDGLMRHLFILFLLVFAGLSNVNSQDSAYGEGPIDDVERWSRELIWSGPKDFIEHYGSLFKIIDKEQNLFEYIDSTFRLRYITNFYGGKTGVISSIMMMTSNKNRIITPLFDRYKSFFKEIRAFSDERLGDTVEFSVKGIPNPISIFADIILVTTKDFGDGTTLLTVSFISNSGFSLYH
jgi:hypothetical protein